MSEYPCAFCDNVLSGSEGTQLREYGEVVAFEDRIYPSTPGHTLVIPRRHVERIGDLDGFEWAHLFTALHMELDHFSSWWGGTPDAYTIGINDGAAAGQSVAHVHLHIIPRTFGDTARAYGGIRWAVPETAAYWDAR